MARGRPYSDYIRSVIGHVANASPEYRHSFMMERNVKRVGYIVVTTDKGLCGGLNVNLLKAVVADLKKLSEQEIEYELCLIGNKGAQPEYADTYCIGAGSEAPATTIMVFSMAPCSSRVRTTFATEEFF